MFSVGLKPMFGDKFSGKTLQSSSFPVLDTDVSYDRKNWGLTLTANGDPASAINKYKTWYVGLRNSNVDGAKSYINHQKITSTITVSLSELDSLDSCDKMILYTGSVSDDGSNVGFFQIYTLELEF
ncbi:hypothetical protein N7454_007565 [Penicillium verhagenii]|nr:hypothetical protein N7454_007565 [Penicillium verhagenii]